MTREEKIAKARVLQGQGLDCQQIAEQLGVGARKTVWNWLNPERAKQARRRANRRNRGYIEAWRDQHRACCDGCGTPLGAGSASPSVKGKTGLCKKCLGRKKAAANAERREEARHLRTAGKSDAEIGDLLGIAPSTVAKWLRKAAEQVAA